MPKTWEQRKLGDLGSLKNGMNFSKDAMGHGYAFVNLQNIFGNNVVDVKNLGLAEASEKQLLEYSLQKGDVLFVRSSVKLEGVGEAALVAETLENTTYSGFIIRFRDEYGLNNDFKKFVFATKKVRDQIMSQATNSANKNISQSALENLTFEIPSKDEQKQIGEYFSNLDHLITLHQRKDIMSNRISRIYKSHFIVEDRMLKIIFGNCEEAIYNTAVYFKNTYQDDWITDELSIRMIEDVDKSTVVGPRLIQSPVLGAISPRELSGGVKTLILVNQMQDKIFNASTCGDNCAKWLLEIGRKTNVTVNLRHIMDFGDGEFEIEVVNNHQVVHNMKELLDVADLLI